MWRGSVGSVALLAAVVLGGPAAAQPFDAWLLSAPGSPTTHGYVEVPHHPSLNPNALTVEFWVLSNLADGASQDCRSLIGKNWRESWWVGICNTDGVRTMRTFVRGTGTFLDGGRIQSGQWQHIALVFGDGTRRHYINGELQASQPLAGNATSSDDPLRILSDVEWEISPNASIDEVRLWNVVRTEAELRANLNRRVASAQPGLVAVWSLDGNGNDVIGARDGALEGDGANFFISAVASDCGAQTATSLCLADRFQVTARWRTAPPGGQDNPAMTIPCDFAGCGTSGLFWFFQEVNWEVMLKALNACGINNRWWLFSAATTNVHYRLTVTDVTRGETKIYFNYPGPPAPAVTDTDAFATCP